MQSAEDEWKSCLWLAAVQLAEATLELFQRQPSVTRQPKKVLAFDIEQLQCVCNNKFSCLIQKQDKKLVSINTVSSTTYAEARPELQGQLPGVGGELGG